MEDDEGDLGQQEAEEEHGEEQQEVSMPAVYWLMFVAQQSASNLSCTSAVLQQYRSLCM